MSAIAGKNGQVLFSADLQAWQPSERVSEANPEPEIEANGLMFRNRCCWLSPPIHEVVDYWVEHRRRHS